MALILLFHFNIDFVGIVGFFFWLEFRNCWHFPSLCVDFRVWDMNLLLNKIKTVFSSFCDFQSPQLLPMDKKLTEKSNRDNWAEKLKK